MKNIPNLPSKACNNYASVTPPLPPTPPSPPDPHYVRRITDASASPDGDERAGGDGKMPRNNLVCQNDR